MGVLDMLTENLVVKLRLGIYCILVFFSFFIFIGISVAKDNDRFCLLYSELKYVAPVSNCNFPIAIAIIFQLVYALGRIVILVLLVLGKFTTDMFLFSNILELLYVLFDVIGCILTFISACILSAGYNNAYYKYLNSVTAYNVAQAGDWISTFFWIIICAVGILYVLRAGKVPFGNRGGASAGAGTASPSAPAQETPQNYDPSKY